MNNFRMGTRLLLGFGGVVLLTLLLGLYALQRQDRVQGLTRDIETRDLRTLQNISALAQQEDRMRLTRERALLAAYLRRDRLQAPSPEIAERSWVQNRDEVQRILAQIETSAASWASQSVTAERADIWRKVRDSVLDVRRALDVITPEATAAFQAINAGDIAAAAARMVQANQAAAAYDARVEELHKLVQAQIELGRRVVQNTADETRSSVIFGIIATVAAGVLFALLIHRSITTPLTNFAAAVERIGKGDLRAEFDVNRSDEIGDLGRSLARMASGLRDLAAQTRAAVENLHSAAAEILASTQQQAAGTAEQAAAVQQANATMAQITQSGAQMSERARQVAATSEAASTASVAGVQSVRNMVSMMESIRQQAEAVAENVVLLSEKTQAVGEIIQTVNDISEQSHLLSLNASIQAAAAGENGRAFSVVASEMKNLAVQSKQATVQVRSILGDIQKGITSSVMLTEEAVKRVESGRQQSAVAENTISELTASIEESVRAFQQIVGGSAQQQIGFEQVTQAVRNISIASQETAASTKQSEKAAANLSSLAQQLRAAVDQYKV